jgi:hypothetical protein
MHIRCHCHKQDPDANRTLAAVFGNRHSIKTINYQFGRSKLVYERYFDFDVSVKLYPHTTHSNLQLIYNMLRNALTAVLLMLPFAYGKTLYLIRHAEKPLMYASDALSTAGEERAQCLTHVFAGRKAQFRPPARIIAQPAGRRYASTRPVDTVRPLAKVLRVPIEEDCDGTEYDCLKETIGHKDDGPILISWQHARLSKIIDMYIDGGPPDYPKDRYDIVWVVDTKARTYVEKYEDCSHRTRATSIPTALFEETEAESANADVSETSQLPSVKDYEVSKVDAVNSTDEAIKDEDLELTLPADYTYTYSWLFVIISSCLAGMMVGIMQYKKRQVRHHPVSSEDDLD